MQVQATFGTWQAVLVVSTLGVSTWRQTRLDGQTEAGFGVTFIPYYGFRLYIVSYRSANYQNWFLSSLV